MCWVSGFVPKSGKRFGEKTVLTRKQNELLLFINKRLNDAPMTAEDWKELELHGV